MRDVSSRERQDSGAEPRRGEGGMPLAAFPALATTEPSAWQAHLARHGISALVEPLGPAPFALALSEVRLGRLALRVERGTACRLAVRAAEQHQLLLHLDGAAPSTATLAGTPHAVDTANAVLLPDQPATLELAAGATRLSLLVPPSALRRRLEAVLGRSVHDAPAFAPALDLTRGPGASLLGSLRWLLAELEREPAQAASPLLAATWEELLLGLLVARLPHSASARLAEAPARDAASWLVRRAEAWLEARAAEPVGMDRLAEAMGVSLRLIQLAFRKERDCTPLEFLRDCRLDLARKRLLRAGEGDTVAQIALDCGFAHLSRFSGAYRRRFGEHPSATLRRRR